MECKQSFLTAALIIVLISGQSSAARGVARRLMLLGAYQPITDPKDPFVVSITQFAVAEHDKEAADDLAFVKVVSGEEQEVDGINYKLDVAASYGDGTENKYLAKVYVNLSRDYRISSLLSRTEIERIGDHE